jgi:hypothetical protein
MEPGHSTADTSTGVSILDSCYDGALSAACILAVAGALGLPGRQAVAACVALCGAMAASRGAREYRRRAALCRHWQRERAREAWELENYPEGA